MSTSVVYFSVVSKSNMDVKEGKQSLFPSMWWLFCTLTMESIIQRKETGAVSSSFLTGVDRRGLSLILCCEMKSPLIVKEGGDCSGLHRGDVRGCVTLG
jgi:hypothetical protein